MNIEKVMTSGTLLFLKIEMRHWAPRQGTIEWSDIGVGVITICFLPIKMHPMISQTGNNKLRL